MNIAANQSVSHMELRATVIRADGTVEDLGTIAYWHKNPFMRLWFKAKKFFRR